MEIDQSFLAPERIEILCDIVAMTSNIALIIRDYLPAQVRIMCFANDSEPLPDQRTERVLGRWLTARDSKVFSASGRSIQRLVS